jgi:CRP/FNR family cyclic AMP-dependent transcriptional regulator
MELVKLLKSAELFDGLSDDQIEQLASISDERTYARNQLVFNQGDEGDRLYVVRSGFVEIIVGDKDSAEGPRTIVNLGRGQVFGEMALVDRGKRSASVRSVDDGTVINSISRDDFTHLCETDTAIGYVVMRNIAADLSFKLRHRNLSTGQS